MPSHLSSIGFDVATQDDFAQLLEKVVLDATPIRAKGGEYLCWTGAAGEQLWLQLDSDRQIIGMNPHFSGKSRIRVGLVSRVTRPDHSKLDGSLKAWASPGSGDPADGEYPFVFDMPDAAVHSDLEIPCIAEAQVAAFAHEVTFFETEESYHSAQSAEGIRFASRSFIPSGLFTPRGQTPDQILAHATFTGEVVGASTPTNPITRQPFYWALVDTLGGRYDVVIDPALLAQAPAVGGFVSGSFWMSGRLTSSPPKKTSWLGRLLGRAGLRVRTTSRSTA